MAATIIWNAPLTAASSIAHGGETRGTITLLRRELIVQPDGRPIYVPVISGNSFRGRLRRIGEELLRDTLGYEGQLSLPAAHALRGGGSLAKTSSEPLSGRRLRDLRTLVPHVGVFGCAGGGRIIDGCLQVGKIVPHVAETAHIVGEQVQNLPVFQATQIETYIRQDDTTLHSFADVLTSHWVPVDDAGLPILDDLPAANARSGTAQLMMYRIETFPAGTRFSSWLRLERATDLEVAFFTDVLDAFVRDPRIGGRGGIGHGIVQPDLARAVVTGDPGQADWRTHVQERRGQALTALESLT